MTADNLGKAGWSWGCVSTVDSNGRTICIADAHRDENPFVVRADDLARTVTPLKGIDNLPDLAHIFRI